MGLSIKKKKIEGRKEGKNSPGDSMVEPGLRSPSLEKWLSGKTGAESGSPGTPWERSGNRF